MQASSHISSDTFPSLILTIRLLFNTSASFLMDLELKWETMGLSGLLRSPRPKLYKQNHKLVSKKSSFMIVRHSQKWIMQKKNLHFRQKFKELKEMEVERIFKMSN